MLFRAFIIGNYPGPSNAELSLATILAHQEVLDGASLSTLLLGHFEVESAGNTHNI